ncbi:xylan glycosyltransferase MUCI21 [Ziziphus jujuba]|uniref:Xylan glycosyltransferase MUCI21 n=1 Tax=Ziziphus jujuba TaxID=326968 RepID=A0A6P4BG27_ZIZJJ|nr:xylan glycosyltransferase MUCI21 [Ziziphus jujuba]
MVHYQRYQLWKKGEHIEDDEESQTLLMDCASSAGYYKKTKPKLLSLLLLSLLSCCFILAPHIFGWSSTFSLLYSSHEEDEGLVADTRLNSPLCFPNSIESLCCDRSSIRSDVCIMKGDVRTHSASSSVFLYDSKDKNSFTNLVSTIVEEEEVEKSKELQHEKIKPYTRKWEKSVMETVEELDLIAMKDNPEKHHHCDVQHDVPAVFFSTGGYTGNVYHEFNDGLIPLYITSQHFNKKVIFVILEYHNWWVTKYGDILSHLSDYPPIDFTGDLKTHCFPEAIVGLKIHDELSIDSSLVVGNKSIVDFRNLLDKAYWPRIGGLIRDEEREAENKLRDNLSVSPSSSEALLKINDKVQEDQMDKPKLVILSRNGSRSITNEKLMVKMAEEIGFRVEVLSPDRRTELAKIYRSLNSSDVMVGVHGAAMTHFLFMKPGSVFIQVIPLGTVWAAETYYGEPARKLGLKYIGYEILARESSLSDKYDENDPVLRDPRSLTKKGWQYTKSIYLDDQNVRLDLGRFRKHLDYAYRNSVSRIKRHSHLQSQ